MRHPVNSFNFLPPPARGLRFLRRGSLALMLVSSVLLVYPFCGILAYRWNEAVAVRTAATSVTIVAPTPKPVLNLNAALQILQEMVAKRYALSPAGSPTPKPSPSPKPAATPRQGNRLVIAKIGVDMPITEGLDGKIALRQGAWRLPGTSTPDRGGNTVIGGHRWLFRPPSNRTFYLLDQVAVDDSITVTWGSEIYAYRVKEVKIVLPSQVEILNATKDPTLTLFTCTPLFSSEKRLVVVAEKI